MALNKKNTYTDYTILSEPRFKSGVAVIDNAVEKGAQPRNTKRYRKYNQPTVASPAGLKEALKARQRKLADAGYYKGKIDGIWGKLSKAAQKAYDKANGKKGETVFESISRTKQNLLNQVKGIESKGQINTQLASLGSAFMSLFLNLGLSEDLAQTAILKLPKKPIDRYGNLTDLCAAYVNKVLMDNGKFSKGNAPQVNRQFKTIYSGYSDIDRPDMSNYSHADSVKTILGTHHQAADNFAQQMDTTKLDRNHMYPVNMYYGHTPRRGDASPHTTDFYEMGINNDTPGSHVGLVYSDPEKGWRVTHNIHGKIHDEPLTSVLGSNGQYGIISMSDAGEIKDKPLYKEVKWYDPRSWFKYGGLLPKKFKSGGYFYNGKVIKGLSGLTVTPVKGRVNTAWDVNDILKEIQNNYKYYVNELGLTDDEYRSIANTLMGIGGVESEYGSGKRYKAKSLLPDIAVDIYHVAKGKPGLQSRGIYQLKIGEEWIGALPVVQAQYRNAYSKAGMPNLNQAPLQVTSSPVYATRAALIRLANDAKDLRSQPLFNKNGERVRLSDALAFRWHYGNDKNIKDSEINHDLYVTRARDYATRFLYK